MRFKVLLPHKIFLNAKITKLVAEAENGSFGILPRHIDFVTIVVPGILSYVKEGGDEEFIAVDEGVLVKQGSDVFLSTRNAIQQKNLSQLQKAVEDEFLNFDDREKKARSATAMMEAEFIRKFLNERQ